MPRRLSWFLLLLPLIAGDSVAAAPVPDVQIDQQGKRFAVSARLLVEVTQATAWAVITDYNRLGDFVPDMEESRIVSGAGEPTLVRQSGAWKLLGFRVPVEIIAQVEEQPMRSLRFHSIGGNVRVENGEWRIVEEGEGVAITYHVECTPEFWVPPVFGVLLIRRDVRAKLEQVAREMLRRSAARRQLPLRNPPPDDAVARS